MIIKRVWIACLCVVGIVHICIQTNECVTDICFVTLKASAWLGSCILIDEETPLAQTFFRIGVDCQYIIQTFRSNPESSLVKR